MFGQPQTQRGAMLLTPLWMCPSDVRSSHSTAVAFAALSNLKAFKRLSSLKYTPAALEESKERNRRNAMFIR